MATTVSVQGENAVPVCARAVMDLVRASVETTVNVARVVVPRRHVKHVVSIIYVCVIIIVQPIQVLLCLLM